MIRPAFAPFILSWFVGVAGALAATWDAPPDEQTRGQFWRLHWYERGLTNGNPGYDPRFRINSPEASVTSWIAKRPEARANGLMLIRAEEDLLSLAAAELYLELWGGHPGTTAKRVTINGRSTYYLPRVGTEDNHCTYSYPTLPLKLSDLVNGYNACQFALDQGSAFWGHALIDNACLRVALNTDHPDLKKLSLASFNATVRAQPQPDVENLRLRLQCPAELTGQIARVDFQGWYYGYDENGNLRRLDWHGFTKDRIPTAHLGTSTTPPFETTWDTTLTVAQTNVAVRAIIHFRTATNLVYLTPAALDLAIPERRNLRVAWLAPQDLPAPFWSRADQRKQCTLDLDLDPARIEKAELHTVAWTGGPGAVREYFKLNGVHYPIAEGDRHELVYSRLDVDPRHLQRGRNLIELRSDTEHHGIELCYPGPNLVIRYRSLE